MASPVVHEASHVRRKSQITQAGQSLFSAVKPLLGRFALPLGCIAVHSPGRQRGGQVGVVSVVDDRVT